MTLLNDFPLSVLQFYATAPYPCSYLPDRMARSQVATPSHLIDAAGLQRTGASRFPPQRRVHLPSLLRPLPRLRAGAHLHRGVPGRTAPNAASGESTPRLEAEVLDLKYSPEHYALYLRYQSTRHAGGGMDQDSREQYRHFLLQSNVDSRLVEFREHGVLRMVSILDELQDGMSSVYTFFDPEYQSGELRHLQHPVADRQVPEERPAVPVSRLLDCTEPQDGLQDQLPADAGTDRRPLAAAGNLSD